MINIQIKSIPHNDQKYDTAGDYTYNPDGSKEVRVSAMSDPRYEFLVAIHELIEMHLMEQRGISDQSVVDFDKEKLTRPDDPYSLDPGMDPKAPYHREHLFATELEYMLALEMGVVLDKYNTELDTLDYKPKEA